MVNLPEFRGRNSFHGHLPGQIVKYETENSTARISAQEQCEHAENCKESEAVPSLKIMDLRQALLNRDTGFLIRICTIYFFVVSPH